jgi:hypothetical protein
MCSKKVYFHIHIKKNLYVLYLLYNLLYNLIIPNTIIGLTLSLGFNKIVN